MFVLFFLLSLQPRNVANGRRRFRLVTLLSPPSSTLSAEAAELLGVHRTTLYDYVRHGRLNLVRSAGRTFVTANELARFLSEETEPVQVSPRRTA